jgi:hypothetical protein
MSGSGLRSRSRSRSRSRATAAVDARMDLVQALKSPHFLLTRLAAHQATLKKVMADTKQLTTKHRCALFETMRRCVAKNEDTDVVVPGVPVTPTQFVSLRAVFGGS